MVMWQKTIISVLHNFVCAISVEYVAIQQTQSSGVKVYDSNVK